MPFIDDKGEAHYDMNADDFARHTKHLVEVGAGIVGGCCGTTPEYIREAGVRRWEDKKFQKYRKDGMENSVPSFFSK